MGLTLTDSKRRILSLLEDEPRHGYVLAKELNVQGSTIYQHLSELEAADYIEGEEDGRRTVYSLTEKAELILRAERS
ncbi:winged helix-turn-helix domain-containing protein [Halorubrum tebenquichense]|jgi:DNA-binding PadR family transcriptional regulator|uniref:ArsR family transcription regulator n=1 Tax=Halorubrum tebenquichense DSM 14210 TaxID=1227485 RepID=M0DW48_9EURY|nr:winged helix-turn-helix domain-containing protein [Halorubrum tebenquichense]ELZ39760.1 ArsR family transcription regulator [Halorubrum tebenquichense DSM 14210]